MSYDQLTSHELLDRLQTEEGARSALRARLDRAVEQERLVLELELHQHELEAQNEELRRVQRELVESRNRYADLFDRAPIPYCTFDRDGNIREINLAGASLFDVTDRPSIVGRPLARLARVEDPVAFSAHVGRCLKSKAPVAGQLTLTTRRGTRQFQLISTAVLEAQGADVTCRTAFLDVTEQQQAEQALERTHSSERALRERLEQIDRASAAANAALAELSGSDISAFLDVLVEQARALVDARYAALGIMNAGEDRFDPWVFAGITAEQAAAIGRTPRAVGLLGAVVSEGRPIRVRDLRQHAASSGWPARHPEMTSFLGVPIYYQGQSRGNLYLADKRGADEFTEEDQTLAQMLANRAGVAIEIARLHQNEARQRASAQINADRLTSALESIDDALALYDAEGRLVLCNRAYQHLLGAEATGELIGKTYAEILRGELDAIAFDSDAERARFGAERLADGSAATRFELRTRDGRSLRAMNRPTPEGGIVQTIWDLTEDVRRERELNDAREAAEVASAAKSDFLSSMSHELRTPLNAILGFAQLLERDKKQPLHERHRDRVSHILRGGAHLLSLIDEVLDLARIEAGRVSISLEPVELASLLEEVKTTLEPAAERAEVSVVLEPMLDGPVVMADRTRLRQILMNYGSNAIKYGRKGGAARFSVRASERFIRVVVSDDGIGIPLDKQDKIFEPFQRAGQEAGPIEGTGIGLAITKRLAELMHGSVGFRSVEQQGSEFWIELPLSRAAGQALGNEAPARSDSAVELGVTPGAKRRVVYVEDNPSNVALVKDFLADFEGIELVTAANAEVGLELIRATMPDVVIMDINLPGMSGIEAKRWLNQWTETRDMPVIALTAAVTAKDAAKVREAGFDRILTKPLKVDELALALEELLQRL